MKDEVVIDYTNNSNPNNVNIDITVNNLVKYCKDERINTDERYKTDLYKTFKLSSKISCTNMYLHINDNGYDKLVKYNNVNDIIKDFYDMRYKIYQKRKNEYLRILKYELEFIKYKVKFINDKINGIIRVDNVSVDELIEQLEDNNYPIMSYSYNDDNKTYNYLTDMKILYLTKEYRDKLKSEMDKKQKLYDEYSKKTIEEIWLSEINEFETEYKKVHK